MRIGALTKWQLLSPFLWAFEEWRLWIQLWNTHLGTSKRKTRKLLSVLLNPGVCWWLEGEKAVRAKPGLFRMTYTSYTVVNYPAFGCLSHPKPLLALLPQPVWLGQHLPVASKNGPGLQALCFILNSIRSLEMSWDLWSLISLFSPENHHILLGHSYGCAGGTDSLWCYHLSWLQCEM